MKALQVKFCTKIYDPNVKESSAWYIRAPIPVSLIFKELQDLIANPNQEAPQDPAMAVQYMEKRAEYDKTARKWTYEYAE